MGNKDIFMNFWKENKAGFESGKSHITSYDEYAPAKDRKAWEEVDGDYRGQLINLGSKYLDYTFKAIPASLFHEFYVTGNRVHFEDAYFEKRRVLNALVLAECAEHSGRFMEKIIDGIFSVCEESAWQLPAHNSYERNKPQYPYPDSSRPVMDLFACETGAMLAMVMYLLHDELDEVSPFINKRMAYELRNRIIIPYLNIHFWWMGNGDEPMCNWTAWCYQNCLITYFIYTKYFDGVDGLTDLTTKLRFIEKACYGLDCFLKDYGDDGCCNEGAQYFRHAGLCMYGAMKVMDYVTNGAFSVLYKNEKIKNTAKYIMNMHVQDIYYINFADCSPIAGRCNIREYLFGKSLGLNGLMNMAAGDYQKTDDKLNVTEINLFYRLLSVFNHSEVINYSATEYIEKPDMYYESVGIFLARDSKHTLAVKSGCNDDSHNHNDTGSITVYTDGKPFLIDVGVETYTKKTFSPDRYEIWTMQSSYHNLPEINGFMQHDGRQFCAKDVKVELDCFVPSISMDIASAYPDEAGVKSYKREVSLHKATFNPSCACEAGKSSAAGATGAGVMGATPSYITVYDTFSVEKGDVTLSLMTYEEPVLIEGYGKAAAGEDCGQTASDVSASGMRKIKVGELGTIEFIEKAPADISIEEIPITDARLMTAWKHSVYRIRIKPHDNFIKFVIR